MSNPLGRLARLALVSLLATSPAQGSGLAGQLVLQSESEGQRVSGMFTVPGNRARLRIFPMRNSEARIEINQQVIFDGALNPSVEGAFELTAKTAVRPGKNTLMLQLRGGDVAVSVDYPELTVADAQEGLSEQQKRTLRQTLNRYLGTHPDENLFPGAALLVARGGKVLFTEGQGMAQYQGAADGRLYPYTSPRKVSVDTVFDLASVTKVVSTSAAIMHLVSERKLALNDTLAKILPGMRDTDKAEITIEQLLTHRAGLWEWQPSWLYKKHSRASVYTWFAALPLRYQIGERRAYSDIGYMLLGQVIEQITGIRQDEYVQQQIFRPLGMHHTRYLPPPGWRVNTAATSMGNPYEQHMIASGEPYPLVEELPFPDRFRGYRSDVLNGEVNDGNAWYGLEGVAGHAGLFSTLNDLAIYFQALLNGGGYGNFMLADPETLDKFLQTPFDTHQALGFWRYESGDGRESFGHAGFTGTQVLFRPDDQLIVILLTNRQHNGLNSEGRYPSVKPAWNAVLDVLDDFWAGDNPAD